MSRSQQIVFWRSLGQVENRLDGPVAVEDILSMKFISQMHTSFLCVRCLPYYFRQLQGYVTDRSVSSQTDNLALKIVDVRGEVFVVWKQFLLYSIRLTNKKFM